MHTSLSYLAPRMAPVKEGCGDFFSNAKLERIDGGEGWLNRGVYTPGYLKVWGSLYRMNEWQRKRLIALYAQGMALDDAIRQVNAEYTHKWCDEHPATNR